jgi:hypothetical protein
MIERLSIEVTFSLPDWFGEGEDWSRCEPPYWQHTNGNHASERLYAFLEKHDIPHVEDCMDPMGKWVKVELKDPDNGVNLTAQLMVVHNWLNMFILNEEERRGKNPPQASDDE